MLSCSDEEGGVGEGTAKGRGVWVGVGCSELFQPISYIKSLMKT